MTNEEQLAILRQGVGYWKKWRERSLVEVNLAEANKGRAGRGQGDGYAGQRNVGGETGVERMRRCRIKNR